MAVRSTSRGLAGLLGPTLLMPTAFAAMLTLAACQSVPPVTEAVAPLPASPPTPGRVATRSPRLKRPDASCLTAGRKQELFRQFAALQEGDPGEPALATDTPRAPATALVAGPAPAPGPQAPCKPAEK